MMQAGHRANGGLSPRVRGNHIGRAGGVGPNRSIPACTGEPAQGRVNCPRHQVYPRVYGGTPDRKVPS